MNASDGTNPNENNSNPSRPNDRRKGKGRQKLRMEKIENEKNLQVTFSKRRAGLFKKASELSTLCGAESALVVFSAGNKAHSYGHPDVETIANRFLNTNVGPTPPANPLLAAHHAASNRQLNQELVYKEGLLERERQRNRELNLTFKPNISKMSYKELNQLQQDVLGFKSIFESRLKDATSLEGSTNIQQESNLYQQGGPSVGFTIPGGFDMTSFPNSGDPTHWVGNSTPSYPAPFNPNIGSSMFQYPHGAGGSALNAGGSGCADGSNVLIPCNYNNSGVEAPHGDWAATTSNIEPEDETQNDVSNKSHSRGSKHNNRCGGRS